MTHKLKALGLALVGVMALSAVVVSPAYAGSADIGSSTGVVKGAGESGQEVVLSVQNTAKAAQLKAKCTTASFEGGTFGQNVSEITVTATYGTGKGEFSEVQGCAVGGIKSQVLMNGCKYTITGAGQAEKTARVDIVGCTEGKQIEVKVAAGGCTLKIGAQNELSHVVGSNLTAQEGTASATVTGIKVQQGGGATCPDGASAHTGTSGAFTGNTTINAFVDPEGIQFSVTKHGHQYFEKAIGAAVSITIT